MNKNLDWVSFIYLWSFWILTSSSFSYAILWSWCLIWTSSFFCFNFCSYSIFLLLPSVSWWSGESEIVELVSIFITLGFLERGFDEVMSWDLVSSYSWDCCCSIYFSKSFSCWMASIFFLCFSTFSSWFLRVFSRTISVSIKVLSSFMNYFLSFFISFIS